MKPDSGTLLCSAIVFSNDGHQALKTLMKTISKTVHSIETSSIYSVKGIPHKVEHIHDLRSVNSFSGLTLSFKASTQLQPGELLDFFKSLEREFYDEARRRSMSLNLLMFNDLTLMTPELTLPHPDFHLRPEYLIPSAEVWGEMIHPVLNQSLKSLTKPFEKSEWGEFFAQGETVLAF